MDPFTVIVLGGSAGLVLALLLLARPVPRVRAGHPQPGPRAAAGAPSGESDDLEELLEATNRRRRRRGEPERSAAAVRADLAAEVDVLRARP